MTRIEKALAALANNEPIDWLLGSALRAGAKRGEDHFLLHALAEANRHDVRAWNAWIAEFRSLLLNPDTASAKASAELDAGPLSRIGDFMAEVLAILHLSRLGYTNFKCVLASDKKEVDFLADKSGKKVRIEVKHLHEPSDIIRNVAQARWRQRQTEFPNDFNFSVLLKHNHHEPLTEKAISELKNVVDQLPKIAAAERKVILDGDITIWTKRFDEKALNESDPNQFLLARIMENRGGKPGLIVQSDIRANDLEFDLPDMQRLFVKAFRTVGDATSKFFLGRSDPHAENVLAMRWQAPDMFYHDAAPELVKQAIEAAFAVVDLQLSVFIFGSDPEPNFAFVK